VVHANILAADTPITGVFNIASGTHISITDLATVVMDQCRSHKDIIYDSPRPGDIKHSRAAITKARETLGYTPQFTITQGVRETIQWFQGH
jgi:nucleoside-diphosphate-sugar epimerase